MESIINPWFIYLLSMLDAVGITFGIATFIFGIIAVIYILGFAVIKGNPDFDEDSEEAWVEGWGKKGKLSIILFLLFLPLAVLIPTKNTAITMFVANEITYDRVGKVGEIAKDAKDSIKKDVMDIIDSFKE